MTCHYLKSFLILMLCVNSLLLGTRANDKTASVQQKGHAYFCTTYWNYSSSHFWNSSGKRRNAFNQFNKDLIEFYAEYGLTARDTVWLKEGWARIDESVNGRTFGFTDMEIGWRRLLGCKWNAIISAEVVGITPLEENAKPGLRYGRWGGEINLLMTGAFSGWKNSTGVYDLRLGYRGYEGAPSDQIKVDATARLPIHSKICLLVGGRLDYGLFNGSKNNNQCLFSYQNNYRLLLGRAELLFNIYKGASAFIGCQKHIWGKNVGTGEEWYAGFQIQL